MHTRFSGDSEANPKDMIAAAKDRGLAGLIFTDH
ncbi:MAG: PHP domain-containing protein, partial [Lachnospiraceae bacterium]|nr:PHP domain-containing protein [Lachnospiraceae bacterium]